MKRFLLSIFFLFSTYGIGAGPTDFDKLSEHEHARQESLRTVVPTNPLLMRAYATPYAAGVAQQPRAGIPGQPVLSFGTDGGRNLTPIFGVNTKAQALCILDNGSFLIAVDDPDNDQVKVGAFNGDGYLNSAFGTAGIATIAQKHVTDMHVTATGDIVLVGAPAETVGSWIAQLTPEGVLDTSFGGLNNNPSGFSLGDASIGFYAVGQQQSGRLIACGDTNAINIINMSFTVNGLGIGENAGIPVSGTYTMTYYVPSPGSITQTTQTFTMNGYNGVNPVSYDVQLNFTLTNTDPLGVVINSTLTSATNTVVLVGINNNIARAAGGIIYGYTSFGGIDESFNPVLPFGFRGYYQPGASTGIYDIAINLSSDDTYFVYMDSTNHAVLAKLNADGSALDTTFGTAGSVASAVRIPNMISESQIRLAVDQSGNIVVGIVNATNQYAFRRYTQTGAVDTTFNGGAILTVPGIAVASITHMMATQTNQILVVGYDNSADNNLILIRLNDDGTLDTDFSSTGILPYQLDSDDTVREARYGAIHPTGQIFVVGFENNVNQDPAAANNPIIVDVYGDAYVPEQIQSPNASPAGTLDRTFDGGQNSTIIVNDIIGLSSLADTQAEWMHVFSNGNYLLASQGTTVTYLTQLTPMQTISLSFHGGAILPITTGTVSSTLNGFALDLASSDIDYEQDFYLVGTNTTNSSSLPWANHVSFDGVVDPNFILSPVPGMLTGTVINQQSFGRLIIAGKNSSTGIVAGYTTSGAIDTGFGNGTGAVSVPGSTEICAMGLDAQDRIMVAYKDQFNNLALVRIYESGLGVDPSFVVTSTISGVAANDQIQLAIDNNGNILVAAATATNYKVRRYNSSGALDTTFNGTGELSFQFTTTTGTPVLTKLLVESSGKILVLGFNAAVGDKRAIQARLLSTGYLDPSFNPDAQSPYQPGILEIFNDIDTLQYRSEDVQIDRRLLLFGNDAGTGNLLLTRIFGDNTDYVTTLGLQPAAGVDGLPDLSLHDDGYTNLTSLVGASKVKVVKGLNNGQVLIAVDTGSVTKLVSLNTESTLNTSFNGGGVATTTCPTGVTDMFIDSNGQILVLGTSSGASWLRRYNQDGSNNSGFGTSGLVTNNIQAGNAVVVQQGGRILVAGRDNNEGCIIAYTSNGLLDTSFAGGTGKLYVGAATNLYNVTIDTQDRIYVAYCSNSLDVTVARYSSNGSGLDTSFGLNGTILDALNVPVTAANQVFIGLDQYGNVDIAGTTANTLVAARYTNEGVLDTTFGTLGYATVNDPGVTLTDLLIGMTSYVGSSSIIALVGYKANSGDNIMYIAWLDETGALDTNYNPSGADAGMPGTVEYDINEAYLIRQLSSGIILNDGRIVVVGYETTETPTNVPLLMRRYSQRYAPQSVVPTFGVPGTLDPSLNGDGVLPFNFTSGTVDQYGQAIWNLADGSYIIGGYGTTDTDSLYNHFLLLKVQADGSADTTFGNDGVVVTPLLTTATSEYLQDLITDYVNRIVVVGYDQSQNGLIRRYLSDGTLDTTFGIDGTSVFSAVQFYAVGMQSSGRLIAIGSNSAAGNGIVVAYDLAGEIDPSFGNGGIVSVPNCNSLQSMVIDQDDSILLAYQNDNLQANITRIQGNGLPYDSTQAYSTFGVNGTISNVFGVDVASESMVKIAIDAQANIIIAASIANLNTAQMRRYLPSGQVDTTFHGNGSAVVITIETELDRTAVKRLMANTVGQYAFIGYEMFNDETSNPIVVQVTNNGYLDEDFNPEVTPGYNIFSIPMGGAIQELMGAVISSEGKIIGVGQEFVSGHYKPFAMSMFDTQYSGEVDRQPAFISGGQILGYATDYASGFTTAIANQEVRAVRQLANLQLMTVVSNGNQSWTLQLNQDNSHDITYGSGTGVLISQYSGAEVVNQMQLDGDGNMLIVGTHSTQRGYLKRVMISDGSMSTVFGGNGSDPLGTFYNIMDNINAVAQLSNGNLLVVGNTASVGTATMISSTGAVVSSFATNGSYSNGANMSSVSVDANNNIYLAVGYVASGNQVRIVKLNSAGVPDNTFGVGGVVDVALANVDNTSNIRLALDPDNNVVVAASWNGTPGKVAVARYTQAGVFDQSFNNGNPFNITFSTDTQVFLTGLLPLVDSKILVSGYQYDSYINNNNDTWFVAELQQQGIYDDQFNTHGQIAGLVTYQIPGMANPIFRHNQDIWVKTNGNIVLAGGDSPVDNQEIPYLLFVSNEPNIQGVAQYPGAKTYPVVPNTLYPAYGNNGIVTTGTIVNLIEGGYVALDLSQRVYAGGLTASNTLVAARFTAVGVLDESYGSAGIATSPVVNNLVNGGSLALDRVTNKAIIGGYTSEHTLAVARFTTAGLPDTTFSTDGLAQTATITNLANGGYVAVNFENNKILVGGRTSDNKLVVARFTSIGDADSSFGTAGIAKTGVISNLADGGYIVVDNSDKVYVGGFTTDGKFVVAKFTDTGVLDIDFSTDGIAYSAVIPYLVGIGSIALDSAARPVLGGYTTDKYLAAARFTPVGTPDLTFNGTGIATSQAIVGLNFGGHVILDGLDRIVLGGYVISPYGQPSMSMVRFTGTGALDTSISATGSTSTGTLAHLAQGGFVAVDNFNRIIGGGLIMDGGFAQLITAMLYSGDEIVIQNPDILSPQNLKIFYYGNNSERFRRMIMTDFYLQGISSTDARGYVAGGMEDIISSYIAQYEHAPLYNLVWNLYVKNVSFDQLQANALDTYDNPTIQNEINIFFEKFNQRKEALSLS